MDRQCRMTQGMEGIIENLWEELIRPREELTSIRPEVNNLEMSGNRVTEKRC